MNLLATMGHPLVHNSPIVAKTFIRNSTLTILVVVLLVMYEEMTLIQKNVLLKNAVFSLAKKLAL
jgi:hypothetical protein